tara:strand:- start:1337 stop:1546 length:210 start_codon:yes stop_codon:yes gene_type:complete
MKFALICPNEPVLDGYRVAQVETVTFPVGDPTYWMECADDVVADVWYFKDGVILQRTDIIPPSNGLQSM